MMYDNRVGRGEERLEASRQLSELHPWHFKYLYWGILGGGGGGGEGELYPYCLLPASI